MTAEQRRAHESLDRDLIRVLAHPSRVHALHILNRRVASPKELAPEVGETVGNMAYHVRQLEQAGYVELVRTEPRRGAKEHFYRATKAAVFSAEEWALVPHPLQARIVGMQLKETGKMLSRSLESGAFERRPTRHHSLNEFTLDEAGFNAIMDLLDSTMERAEEIAAQSAERMLASDAPLERIPTFVSLIGAERDK
ncbi:MAG TPA: winged helix-turn-helix domain-containing protein [Solirubrobacterales bacterium]|nr:winged helix-turn-helix domain-containing protein [Solirubrobacterales bacterium]